MGYKRARLQHSILTFGLKNIQQRAIALFLLTGFVASMLIPTASVYAAAMQTPEPPERPAANEHVKQYDPDVVNKPMPTNYAGPLAEQQVKHPAAADAEQRATQEGAFSGDATSLSAPLSGPEATKLPVKELVEKRTATSKSIRNADGTITEKQYLVPQHYKKDGKWETIHSNLVEDTNAANSSNALGRWWGDMQSKFKGEPTTFKMQENAWQSQFAPSDDAAGMVRITYKDDTITFRPIGAASVAPVVTKTDEGQKVAYKELWPGINVEYKVENHLLKEYSILKSKDATNAYGFAIDGATLEADPDHEGGFRPKGALKDVVSIAPLLVLDAQHMPIKEKVATQAFADGKLHVTVDKTWLKGLSAERYPIVVDPTTWVETWTGSWSHHYAYGESGWACDYAPQSCEPMAGNHYGEDIRTAIKAHYWFAWGRQIKSVNLLIGQMQGSTGTGQTRLITAHNADCLAYSCLDTSIPTASAWVYHNDVIDVTNIFKALQVEGNFEPWIMLTGEEWGTNTLKIFNPSQTHFEFTYGPAAPTMINPNPGEPTTFIDPQPAFRVVEPTLVPGPHIQHIFRVTTKKNAGTIFTSGKTSNRTWTVPDGILDDGTTYYVQAQAYEMDSDTYSNWSDPLEFRIDTRNGKDSTQQFDTLGPVSVGLATGNLTTGASSHTSGALGGSLGVNLEYNTPNRSRNGLVAQYFNNTTYSGTPVVTQIEPHIMFEWASGPGSSPVPGVINDDYFSALWKGYFVAPKTASYQFGCNADDSGRIWVNNQLVSERWTNFTPGNAACPWSSPIPLIAGQIVPYQAAHKEEAGYSIFDALVKTTDNSIPEQAIPTEWLQTGVRPVDTKKGLLGRYYTDNGTHNFNDAANQVFVQRTDPLISFNWGTEGPVPSGVTKDFMARWTGYLTVPATGSYELATYGDDGMRIKINNTTVTDTWYGGPNPITYGSSVALTGGVPVPITVEFYDGIGAAFAGVYIKSPTLSIPEQIIPSEWLSTDTAVLPSGWNLGIDPDGSVSYERLKANQNSVVLTDSTGSTHEYTWTGSAYKPPVNEDGQLVQNQDGTFTLLDVDGRTYVFNTAGLLISLTTPTDDRKPAALKYNYATINNGPSRLVSIVDGVDASRWANVYYSGDTECGSAPTGFDAQAPANMLCAVKTNDGRATYFYYSNSQLARIAEPGSEYTDYMYETLTDGSKRIAGIRDVLANDAIAAGQRTADNTVLTQVEYDEFGRVKKVVQPAATVGATRIEHTIKYFSGDGTYAGATEQHVVGASEPHGFSRRIEYDKTLRTTKDIDVTNQATTTEWDASKDMVKSVTDPTSLKSTTIYNDEDRPIHQYGPAPTAWYGTDNKPLTAYDSQVPHTENMYDESIVGPEVTYFNYKATNKTLVGAPRLRTTGIDPANPGILRKSWGNTPPVSIETGYDGWGLRAVGKLRVPTTGTYTFHLWHEDGARFFIDDEGVAGDWNNGANRNSVGSKQLTAGKVYRFLLEYYDADINSSQLVLLMKYNGEPVNADDTFTTTLKPGYGLTTSTKVYDATLGNATSNTNFGANPELGLPQSTSVDPAGLNLTTSSTYETLGAANTFLRQTSKTLPGSPSTNPSFAYAHYAATDTKDNPCTTGVTEAYKQAGFMKLKTEADLDGTGTQTSRTTETIYDDAGRVVATRHNADSWTCTMYDTRGRVTTTVIPSVIADKPDGGTQTRAGRTITNNYAWGGNPLVTGSTDSMGSIVTTVDLLGRTVSYTDVYGDTTTSTYDTLGRLSARSGPLGAEAFVYDSYNRLTQQKLDTVTHATVYYDAYSRIDYIDYNDAGTTKLTLGRDTLGRTNAMTYNLLTATSLPTTVTDTVTRSQSGQIVTDTATNGAASSTWTYGYDGADRLTTASLAGSAGTNTFAYGFGTQDVSCGNGTNMNANAGKNSNRTSQTINSVTTTYCYDYADRLVSSSDPLANTPKYDAHGNTTKIGTGTIPLRFYYDSSDRNSGIDQYDASGNGVAQYYDRDVQGRIVARYKENIVAWDWRAAGAQYYYFTGSGDSPDYVRNNNGTITQKYLQLPGGALLTIRPPQTGNAKKTYSLPNIHGDTLATANTSGALIDFTLYGPFGEQLTGQPTPNNSVAASTFGYVGQHQKLTETGFVLPVTQMGARVYLPTLGRFAQVDPIEGGTENNYVYPADPVNEFDLTGKCIARFSSIRPACLKIGQAALKGARAVLRTGKGGKAPKAQPIKYFKSGNRSMVNNNGITLTKYYHDHLTKTGRSDYVKRVNDILSQPTSVSPDPRGYLGFLRYQYNGWEMYFNPITRELAHLGKVSPKR